MKNLNQLMKQAQQMQTRMAELQRELAETPFTGEAGGVVQVTLSGAQELLAVKIAPAALTDGDAELLEDLITAAFRAAQAEARRASEEKLGGLTGGLGLPGL
ncbi:YbaB/EbfC family nucleoid-associated protein [bacterium]|nr:YbaB/EbfC family nucleoid-associated protein [bacterium]